MKSKAPILSAIVSTYNSEKFFRGKIEDLLRQTIFDSLEIIVVNSGSKQNEETIINEYLSRYPNIKYIRTEERETVYKAWNRGIKAAAGKYLTNANTDDRLRKDAYEILVKELEDDPDVVLIHADQFISNTPNETYEEITRRGKIFRKPEFNYFLQLEYCLVLSQPIWRASLHWDDDLWYDDNLIVCGDHEFQIRVSQKYKIKHLNDVLGVFYVDKKKQNISLRDPIACRNEKRIMTAPFISEYLKNCDKRELEEIKARYKYLVMIPFNILRLINKIESVLFPISYPHTSEFVYYVMALIFQQSGQDKKAARLCRKFLNHRESERVTALLNELKV